MGDAPIQKSPRRHYMTFGPAFSDVAEYARMLEERASCVACSVARHGTWHSGEKSSSAAAANYMPRKERGAWSWTLAPAPVCLACVAACRPGLLPQDLARINEEESSRAWAG